jgi:hypothetical protein
VPGLRVLQQQCGRGIRRALADHAPAVTAAGPRQGLQELGFLGVRDGEGCVRCEGPPDDRDRALRCGTPPTPQDIVHAGGQGRQQGGRKEELDGVGQCALWIQGVHHQARDPWTRGITLGWATAPQAQGTIESLGGRNGAPCRPILSAPGTAVQEQPIGGVPQASRPLPGRPRPDRLPVGPPMPPPERAIEGVPRREDLRLGAGGEGPWERVGRQEGLEGILGVREGAQSIRESCGPPAGVVTCERTEEVVLSRVIATHGRVAQADLWCAADGSGLQDHPRGRPSTLFLAATTDGQARLPPSQESGLLGGRGQGRKIDHSFARHTYANPTHPLPLRPMRPRPPQWLPLVYHGRRTGQGPIVQQVGQQAARMPTCPSPCPSTCPSTVRPRHHRVPF